MTMAKDKDSKTEDSLIPEGKIKGSVVGVAVSDSRGTGKRQVPFIHLKEAYGIVGDGHAGTRKQVSLVAYEDIEHMNRSHGLHAEVGDFAENIATRGIDLMVLSPGDQIRVGPAILRVVRLGKSPEEMKNHSFSFEGYVLLPERGLFCEVLKGGEVRAGDEVSIIAQNA